MTANSKSKSSRHAAMHESAAALHHVGALGKKSMQHFDTLCLELVLESSRFAMDEESEVVQRQVEAARNGLLDGSNQ